MEKRMAKLLLPKNTRTLLYGLMQYHIEKTDLIILLCGHYKY